MNSSVGQAAVILVGTDFSDGAKVALEQARQLGAWLGLGIELVHVLERYGGQDWWPDPVAVDWLRRVHVMPGDLVVRSGFAWIELVRQMGRRPARLVVVGSHGTSGFQPMTLGSTALRLSILSPCPVVVVPTRWSSQPHRSADVGAAGVVERAKEP